MTREQAIRILAPETTVEALTEIEYYAGFSGLTAKINAVFDASEIAVAAIREQEQRRWIPVTERLPDVDGNYIVTACDEGCPCGEGIWYDTVVVVAEYYRGSWTWIENGMEYDLCGIITHWMPLPEPPEKEVEA